MFLDQISQKLQVISLRLVPGPKRNPVGYFGRTLEFDLVMMDCQMPELDGYKAAQTIRKRASPGWELPIYSVSADVSSVSRL
jgi:CheY-like chemotaxis protein